MNIVGETDLPQMLEMIRAQDELRPSVRGSRRPSEPMRSRSHAGATQSRNIKTSINKPFTLEIRPFPQHHSIFGPTTRFRLALYTIRRDHYV